MRETGCSHDHKSMAVSLVLEAAEVLEHFQVEIKRRNGEIRKGEKRRNWRRISRCGIYLIEMADNLGIDLTEAIGKKMDKNEKNIQLKKRKEGITNITICRI